MVTRSVGVLALQGDFAAHAAALGRLGVAAREVRGPRAVAELDGLVIPGGESTTLLRLMADDDWFATLRAFHAAGGALFGTCAGAIVLAREVRPSQPSLGLLDAAVERNAYGRQRDSFETVLDGTELGAALPAVFIRAPRFRALGPSVRVLARHGDEPVLVEAHGLLAATFHPELASDDRVHAHFVSNLLSRRRPAFREAS